eukprot:TRINITY_DN3165_c0_g1_i1.p1 TRINITY_DN3165_c0_g1~~TRINITY_DN3165_c0_g1_i1.p1  ORF type:complete len:1146 (-),score=91.33 TRINITY_DN3165_c0_g1_i1:6051-9374(-)
MRQAILNLNPRFFHSVAARSRTKYSFTPGQTIHGFTFERAQHIPIYDMTGYKLTHQKTKARYFHIDSSNTDNTFSILFRTPPINNSGICHILEHLALCGSKKYPIRDPFFNMLKRSLNTYMNAWTGADFTMYPFSSQNRADFHNLLSVYLDASFFPMLRYEDFMQEGHRLEIDQSKKLQRNGVVYNEMKGAMSDPQDYFSLRLMQNLFQHSSYKYNSGGDPMHIPELTHKGLLEYHAKYYHPSNCWFFSFGDLDFTEHLELIDKNVLSQFEGPREVNSQIAREPRKAGQIKTVEEGCMPDRMRPLNQQGKFAISCLCTEAFADPYETFTLKILSKLLIEGTSTPLYKELIESGLADSYCPGIGFDTSSRDSVFTLGVQGCLYDAEHLSKVEAAIYKVLNDVKEKGFDEGSFNKALHEVLFEAVFFDYQQKQRRTRENYGLQLIAAMIHLALYDSDPFLVFKTTEYANKLREDFEKTRIFQDLVQKYLLNSTGNRIKFIMKPDEHFARKKVEEEERVLDRIAKSMTTEQIKNIKKDCERLKKRQEEQEDVNILPKIELKDIPAVREYPKFTKVELKNGIPVWQFDQPTNEITHIRIKFNTDSLPEALKPYLPLCIQYTLSTLYKNRLLPFIGTKRHKYDEFEKILNSCTNGIVVQLDSYSHELEPNKHNEGFILNYSFLNENMDRAMDAVTELLSGTLFQQDLVEYDFNDNKILLDAMRIKAVEKANNISTEGLQYALSYSSSGVKSYANQFELLRSDVHICRIAQELAMAGENLPLLTLLKDSFEKLMTELTKNSSIEISIHGQDKNGLFGKLNERLNHMWKYIGKADNLKPKPVKETIFKPKLRKHIFKTPQTVNYCVESLEIPPMVSPDYGKLLVLGELLTHSYLHREIRERGGAYGGGTKLNPSGLFSFFSYRDPNLEETFAKYQAAKEYAYNGKFKDQDVIDAKIVAFQKIDRAKDPADDGLPFFLRKVTEEQLNGVRKGILETSRNDLVEASMKYLKEGKVSRTVCSMSDVKGEEKLRKEGWNIFDVGMLVHDKDSRIDFQSNYLRFINCIDCVTLIMGLYKQFSQLQQQQNGSHQKRAGPINGKRPKSLSFSPREKERTLQ